MNHEYSVKLGSRIKEIRKALKLSQADFAASLSISNTFLSAIENAKANPAIDFLFCLAKSYHVSMDYLFYGFGEKFISIQNIMNDPMLVEEKDFIEEIETIEDLNWLINQSTIFNRYIMGAAGSYFILNKEVLKINVAHNKAKKKMEDIP